MQENRNVIDVDSIMLYNIIKSMQQSDAGRLDVDDNEVNDFAVPGHDIHERKSGMFSMSTSTRRPVWLPATSINIADTKFLLDQSIIQSIEQGESEWHLQGASTSNDLTLRYVAGMHGRHSIYISTQSLRDPNHLNRSLEVCKLNFDRETGNVTSVTPGMDSDLLSVLLSDHGDTPLMHNIGSCMGIPSPAPDAMRKYDCLVRECAEMQSVSREMLDASQRLESTVQQTPKNAQQIHIADQGRCAVASSAQKRWLAVEGMSPCFTAAMYNKTRKRGGMPHFDHGDELATLKKLKDEIMIEVCTEVKPLTIAAAIGQNKVQEVCAGRQWCS